MLPLSLISSVVPLDAKPTRARPSVLVVDDEFLIRWSLRELLTSEGFDVEEAATGLAARKLFAERPFSAVLLDIRLPDTDGLGLLQELLATRSVPIILITAHGTEDMAVEALQLGAYGFLRKPFDANEMLTLVSGAALLSTPTR